MSASTGMKFVSPDQRGTMCSCRWPAIDPPATCPRFQPTLKASGAVDGAQGGDRLRGQLVHLGRLVGSELPELADVAQRRDHQMARRVGELVEQHEGVVASVDDEAGLAELVVASDAEHAPVLRCRRRRCIRDATGPRSVGSLGHPRRCYLGAAAACELMAHASAGRGEPRHLVDDERHEHEQDERDASRAPGSPAQAGTARPATTAQSSRGGSSVCTSRQRKATWPRR